MVRHVPQQATAGKPCRSLELRGSSKQDKPNFKESAQSRDLGKLVRRPWHGQKQEAASENTFCRGLIPLNKDSVGVVRIQKKNVCPSEDFRGRREFS